MKLAGIELPEHLTLEKQKLYLNGAGVRNKFFLDIYALALYTSKSITTSGEAVSGKIPRALRIVITSPIVTNQLVTQSIYEGMKKSAGEVFHLIEAHINEIIRVFNDHPIRTGDYYDILYIPGKGMSVYRKDSYASGPQLSNELRDTVFGNWLGEHPRDLRLKRNLLKGY